MSNQRLKPEYEDLKAEFEDRYGDCGCSCHISPPCNACIHPGNPLCLENTPEAWEDIPDDPKDYETA